MRHIHRSTQWPLGRPHTAANGAPARGAGRSYPYRRLALLGAGAALALTLTACQDDTPTTGAGASPSAVPSSSVPTAAPGGGDGSGPVTLPAPSPTSGAPRQAFSVTLERSGGFAGKRTVTTVDATGHWTRDDGATQRRGQLTPEQLDALKALVNRAEWPREAGSAGTSTACADGYVYVLHAGTLTATTDDCARPNLPVTNQIITLLTGATGG